MYRLSPYLIFAGAIPFVFGVLLLVLGIAELPIVGETKTLISVYALVIASFMAGVHWGQHLTLAGKWSTILPIVSNIVAVALWSSFLMLGFSTLMLALIVAFGVLLLVDQRLLLEGVITREYFTCRLIVTMIVSATLVIAAVAAA